jgi:aminoglycoside phosphotransferase (APT) family kinase protein
MPDQDRTALSEVERIEAGLKSYLADGRRITALRSTSDGFSNRTFLVEGLGLVLRIPQLGEPMLAA